MFRFPIIKPIYFNQSLNEFCLKLTKDSVNKYINKIEERSKNKCIKDLISLDTSFSNPSPENNSFIFIITSIGLLSIATTFYFFTKSKK